jgi:alpha-L-fucosidase 2
MRPTRRIFLGAAAVASLPGAAAPDPNLRLWYRQPAPHWNEALPIGNGSLGAMISGGVPVEHLQFNHDTLCSEEPGTSDLPLDVTPDFDRVVTLLRNRQYAEAGELITKHWGGRSWPCYQPLGDLHLHFETTGAVSDYARELDLANAVASVTYRQGGATYTREYFASFPDGLIAARLTASEGGTLDFRASLGSVHLTARTAVDGQDLVMTGQAPGFVLRRTLEWVEQRGEQGKYPELWDKDGKRLPHAKTVLYGAEAGGRGTAFGARLRAIVTGGTVEARSDGLHIHGAREATLLLTASTGFRGFDRPPLRRAPAPQLAASLPAYPALRARHLADYRRLFDRVAIDLGAATAQSALPTDERIARFANDADPSLAALYFQYARYLMIAGSRPGSQPLNLQGIWNDQVIPPWACGYTTNINLEMNYWPVEVCNLSECFEPLGRMLAELAKTGAAVAKKMYRRPGWVLHHNTTLWRGAQPVDNNAMPAFWNVGGGWLASHLWEHYLYTGDRQFLARQGYPIMKGAAEFLDAWLIDDGQGHLVTAAGNSPENIFLYTAPDGKRTQAGITMGPTMDLAIVRELFANCIRAAAILGLDAAFAQHLESRLAKVLPYQVGKRGQLQEWPEDFEEREPTHRHVSHLYPLHPGNQITRQGTPELWNAVQRTLAIRGDEGTGWSRAWKVCFWARLEDGNHAYRIVRNLFASAKSAPGKYDGGGVMPNLFCSCPPMQIDGNFGGAAGIAEMLAQSQHGEIHLLPALPDAWPAGRVTGLRVRGACEVAIEWKGGKLTSASVTSKADGKRTIRYADRTVSIRHRPGRTVRLGPDLQVLG